VTRTSLPQQHVLYPYNDEDGRLAGVVIPSDAPFDTTGQWRAFTSGLLGGLLAQGMTGQELEGLYAVTFRGGVDAAVQVVRLSHGAVAETVPSIPRLGVPSGTLGLLAVIDEPEAGVTSATLAVQGGVTPVLQTLRQDRVIPVVLDRAGVPRPRAVGQHTAVSLRLLGKMLIGALDRELSGRSGGSAGSRG
jgi:hypothetical protein